MEKKTIYDLDLHEEIEIKKAMRTTRILRVANGWNYTEFSSGKYLGVVNVPFDNKFEGRIHGVVDTTDTNTTITNP
jgi:hypothetical protein